MAQLSQNATNVAKPSHRARCSPSSESTALPDVALSLNEANSGVHTR